MTLGEKLKSQRRKMNISLKEQSKLLGVSLNTVYRWEHDLAVPRKATLKTMAGLYNVPLDWLLLKGSDADNENEPEPMIFIMNDMEQQVLMMLRKLSNNNRYKVFGHIERLCMEQEEQSNNCRSEA